tara:strand:+ start:34 stop:363 length:330 start_codon:yes stop_codon:yes gene_type:complete
MNNAHELMKVKLDYPTKPLELTDSKVVLEYVIPMEDKQELLNKLHFGKPQKLNEEVIDINCNKKFTVKDYKVVWENETNYVVSPYYQFSGGTLMEWVRPNPEWEKAYGN